MPSPEQFARLDAMLKETNARMDAAMPAGEPYVSSYVTEGVGLYTEEERAVMRQYNAREDAREALATEED